MKPEIASEATRSIPVGLLAAGLVLTTPYIMWLGVGTQSDVQPYPLVVSILVIGLNFRLLRRSDRAVGALFVAALFISALQVILASSASGIILRGLYGYLAIAPLTLAWILLARRYGIQNFRRALEVFFWTWLAIGVVQLFAPSFATFGREKLIMSAGRGSLSLATEPAYFAFALILLAIAIALLGGSSRILLVATLGTVLVARSGVGSIYALVTLLCFYPTSLPKKLIGILTAIGGLTFMVISAPQLRLSWTLRGLTTDPTGLVNRDVSVAARLVDIVYPVRALFENRGLPHAIDEWPSVLADLIGRTNLSVAAADYSGAVSRYSILSVHGQLLFQLGILAIVYYALILRVLRASKHFVGLAIIVFTVFFNGVTLNSPFLALVLAAATLDVEGGSERTGAMQSRRAGTRPSEGVGPALRGSR